MIVLADSLPGPKLLLEGQSHKEVESKGSGDRGKWALEIGGRPLPKVPRISGKGQRRPLELRVSSVLKHSVPSSAVPN